MARFQPTLNIWNLTPEQRRALQPGQWITAGPNGPLGRFLGEGKGSSVAAWNDNAKRHPDGYFAYLRSHRAYAKANGAA